MVWDTESKIKNKQTLPYPTPKTPKKHSKHNPDTKRLPLNQPNKKTKNVTEKSHPDFSHSL